MPVLFSHFTKRRSVASIGQISRLGVVRRSKTALSSGAKNDNLSALLKAVQTDKGRRTGSELIRASQYSQAMMPRSRHFQFPGGHLAGMRFFTQLQ
jgi:hypothetical protein